VRAVKKNALSWRGGKSIQGSDLGSIEAAVQNCVDGGEGAAKRENVRGEKRSSYRRGTRRIT